MQLVDLKKRMGSNGVPLQSLVYLDQLKNAHKLFNEIHSFFVEL